MAAENEELVERQAKADMGSNLRSLEVTQPCSRGLAERSGTPETAQADTAETPKRMNSRRFLRINFQPPATSRLEYLFYRVLRQTIAQTSPSPERVLPTLVETSLRLSR